MGVTIWYRCLFCTRVFPQAPQLIEHRKINHSEQWKERRLAKKLQRAKIADISRQCENSEEKAETNSQVDEFTFNNKVTTNCLKSECTMPENTFNDNFGDADDTFCVNFFNISTTDCELSPTEVKDVKTFKTRIPVGKTKKRDREYKCHRCDKSFRFKGALGQHLIIHKRKKPYQCDICQKSFAQKGNLHTHKMLHTGEQPFVCSICNKNFRTKAFLSAHELIHSDMRPFPCPHCPLAFRTKGILKTHCNGQHNMLISPKLV